MSKEYLNLILVSYNIGDYIEEFGGYYAGIIDNYILILLDFYQTMTVIKIFHFSKEKQVEILNINKFNGFNDYKLITEYEISMSKKLYYINDTKGHICRRIYLND